MKSSDAMDDAQNTANTQDVGQYETAQRMAAQDPNHDQNEAGVIPGVAAEEALRAERDERDRDDVVIDASMDSFPASDPPSWTPERA